MTKRAGRRKPKAAPAKKRATRDRKQPARKPERTERICRKRQVAQDSILASIQQGATKAAAARAAGVGRTTLWNWCQHDKDFAAAMEAAEGGCIRRVESATYLNALRPEGHRDRRLFLEHRAGWKGQASLEIEIPPVVVTDQRRERGVHGFVRSEPDLQAMSDEQLARYSAALEALMELETEVGISLDGVSFEEFSAAAQDIEQVRRYAAVLRRLDVLEAEIARGEP